MVVVALGDVPAADNENAGSDRRPVRVLVAVDEDVVVDEIIGKLK